MRRPVLVVSGGTRGIGKAVALHFAGKGFEVFASGSNEESVARARSENPDSHIHYEAVDAGSEPAWKAWSESIRERVGTVQVLLLNAGIFLPGTIQSEEPGVFESLIRTNLASAYYGARAILPLMKNGKPAHVFTLCSTASLQAYPNGGSYCITKYGMLGLTHVLREELREEGIGVTAILPGATFTDSWKGSDLPSSRFMQPADLAEMMWAAWSVSPSAVVEEIRMRPMEGDI